ncbi:MAG: hypothetical protein K0R50_2350 [Eubacterium sp.]|jgi:hypothetical protein|nr:hypothetical protein [Eubacterium sp.]
MAIKLEKEIIDLVTGDNAVKVLATTDKDGVPHVVFKGSINIDSDGNLVYLELLESSRTNSNLVNSIWFKKKVAVSVRSEDGRSVQIKGTPVRCLITGPVFEYYYKLISQRIEDADLAAVWVIEPEEVRDETYKVRKAEEEKNHPLLLHLDRLAK